jgi:hypothetical protein
MSLPKEHREETYRKIKAVHKDQIAKWLLEFGYYPEQYVLPPCFSIMGLKLNAARYKERDQVKVKELRKISFPKTDLTEREFAILHPHHYHDIVWELHQNWDAILAHLFNEENKIYSYSFPIPPNNNEKGKKPLRSGRMIYEFLELAEKDLVAEAHRFEYVLKLDITNFYPSIYTHTLCWAWEGRDKSDGRKTCGSKTDDSRLGDRFDKLFQYANDRKTVGLPIGSALSDLMAEFILSERDLKISLQLESDVEIKGNYIATRFKDDYRILCSSEIVAKKIVRILIEKLKEFNFVVHEGKTKIIKLPDGLYRPHAVKYEPYSFRNPKNLTPEGKIHFKSFENVLLKTLEIHREYSGTSLIEKFLSELILSKRTKNTEGDNVVNPIADRLLLDFGKQLDNGSKSRNTKLKKTVSLIFMLKNESPKSVGKVLAIFEHILLFGNELWFREYLKEQMISEIKKSVIHETAFELSWLLYFNCKHEFDIDLKRIYRDLRRDGKIKYDMSNSQVLRNSFIATLRGKRVGKGNIKNPFEEDLEDITLFTPPSDLTETYLIEYLDIFDRDNIEE